MPDGTGLGDEVTAIIETQEQPWPIHLRLTERDSRSCRGACGGGLGEWWSGKANEVTCPACLEVVHA